MAKYVRVDWPESQEWIDLDPDGVEWGEESGVVFVPEELYNRVKGE